MKKKPLFILLCSILIFIGPSFLWASSPGNPLMIVGQGRLAMSAEWEQVNRTVELDVDSDVISNRYWLKGTYGLVHKLDISGAVGMIDFDVSTSQQTPSYSYESHHLTFGFSGGLKLQAYHNEARKMSGILSASGAHLRNDHFVGSKHPSKMTWNELRLAAVVSKAYDFALPYCGLSYFLIDGDMEWKGDVSQDFQDQAVLAFAGIDFSLPSLYVLCIEVAGRIGGYSDEISFSFGLSQRSK